MLCEACEKNSATVHLTDVSNNQKKEVHLCESCAQDQGVTVKSYMNKPVAPPPSVEDLEDGSGLEEGSPLASDFATSSSAEQISALAESTSGTVDTAGAGAEASACSQCGTTYRQFRSSGKFGCPNDYVVFKPKLDDLLEKIHGKNQHIGKVPSRAGDQVAIQEELLELKTDLEQAVKDEQYVRAAELRDLIHRLEGRVS